MAAKWFNSLASILQVFIKCVVWGQHYLFVLIGKSNLQDWGHLGKYWGPVLPNWHSLIPRETLGRNSFEAFNSHKEASLPSEAT